MLPGWIRLALALAGVGVSALIFWNDFRDFMIPDWAANLSGASIIGLWVYILTDFSLFNILTVAATFLLLYSFTRIPLEIVAGLATSEEGTRGTRVSSPCFCRPRSSGGHLSISSPRSWV